MSLARAENPQELLSVSLVIPDDLIPELADIPGLLEHIHDERMLISDASAILDRINLQLGDAKLSDKKRLSLETFKLTLMKAVSKYLSDLNCIQHHIEKEVEKKPSGFLYWLKVGLLSLFALIGLTESSVMTLLGARVLLLSLFPTIPTSALWAVSVLFTVINAVQFIAFEVGMLKSTFGVKSHSNIKKMMDIHDQQIDVTGRINKSLTDVNVLYHLTKNDYLQLKRVAVNCNQDVEAKKVAYHEYKENKAKKALRFAFTGFGALMAVVGSYFGATMFLTTMAPYLLGTPIGWVVIGGLVASSVVFYLAMQGKGLMDMFNPLKSFFDQIKDKVKVFKTISESEFNHVLMNKNVFKKADIKDNCKLVSKQASALDLAGASNIKSTHDGRLFSRTHSQPILRVVDEELPSHGYALR